VKRSDPDVFLTTVAYPIKGTGYFDDVSPSLLTPEVWAAATDRDWQIRGRRPRGYYQFADQLLKSEVALGRLLRDAGPGSTSPQLDVLRQSAQTARKGLHELSSHVEA
jgi:anaerobic magnesium-protoporphyrin IX monomethyl ester cyclase